MSRLPPRNVVIDATLIMGLACWIAAITARLDLLIALHIIQGLAGGTLLVGGQTLIFVAYPRMQARRVPQWQPCPLAS